MAAACERVSHRVTEAVESVRFRQPLERSVRTEDAATVALLRVDDEALPDDLQLADLADRLGVDVDPDVATVVMVEEEQLAPWRRVVATFDRLVWILAWLAPLLGGRRGLAQALA